ncbi:MAG: type II toxin-antitoxin system VapC family toxin [Actinomycetota bacterium]
MIVVDASAVLVALTRVGAARDALALEDVHVPHLVDIEIVSGLRGLVAGRVLESSAARGVLEAWRGLAIRRHPMLGLLQRVWELRDNLSPYDASYVALAEVLGCALVTADRRVGRASGIGCAVTIVPV